MAAPQGLSPQESLEEFKAGVTACLRSWSALRTAVESQWGGVESAQKADDLRQNILEHFDGKVFPPKLQQEDLEDNLSIYMEEEFSITLEDQSERQVADSIFRLYEFAHRGDCTLARQMVAQCTSALSAVATYPTQVQTMEHDDDDDDDMVVPALQPQQPPEMPTSAKEYNMQPLFGGPRKPKPVSNLPPVRQLGVTEPEPEGPMVDDDGFAPVVRKR